MNFQEPCVHILLASELEFYTLALLADQMTNALLSSSPSTSDGFQRKRRCCVVFITDSCIGDSQVICSTTEKLPDERHFRS
jgi:hypothetical protein